MDYDLGYIDLEEKTLQPLNNPFGPTLLYSSSSYNVGDLIRLGSFCIDMNGKLLHFYYT
jgi:hypothetical protein